MKKVVPFTKTITFKTMIAEVTDIEVTHDLSLKENNEISGNILVDGRYKMTEASQIEEEFHYKLPFLIDIDSKYDLNNLEIVIGDFYFEIINEENLKINVEIDMDGLEEIRSDDLLMEKTEVLDDNTNQDSIPIPVEINDTKQELEFTNTNDNPLSKLAKEIHNDLDSNNVDNTNQTEEKKENIASTSVGSIFSSLASNEETFSTYYVYIVRENDTLEFIMDKYKVTRELLQSYNDLDDIKVGNKLIIPCASNE